MYPGAGTLADVAGISRRVVFDAVAALEHFGWLRVYRDETADGRKKGADTRANSYWLCFPVVSGAHRGSAPGAPMLVSGAHPNSSEEGGRRAGQSPTATPVLKGEEEQRFKLCGECTASYAGSCRDEGTCLVAMWRAEDEDLPSSF